MVLDGFILLIFSNPLMNLLRFFQIVFLGEKVDERRDLVSSGDCTFIKKTQKNNLASESYYLHFLRLPISHSYCRRNHISPMAVTQALARCPRWVNLPLELAFHISHILFIDARYPICGHLLIQAASWSEKVSVSDCFWVKLDLYFFYVPGFTLSPQSSSRHSWRDSLLLRNFH